MTPKKVLFLCSGNYYRSRFAEELFNHLAQKNSLGWVADSRALLRNPWSLGNYGPISPFAMQELEKRAIPFSRERFPKQLEAHEISEFQRIIALDRDEHQPMIETDYPWLTRLDYWDIKDLRDEPAESALRRLENHLQTLIHELSALQ